jgi:hypothetical protein
MLLSAILRLFRNFLNGAQIKTLSLELRGFANWPTGEALGTYHVGRLKSLGAFEQIEFDSLALI